MYIYNTLPLFLDVARPLAKQIAEVFLFPWRGSVVQQDPGLSTYGTYVAHDSSFLPK